MKMLLTVAVGAGVGGVGGIGGVGGVGVAAGARALACLGRNLGKAVAAVVCSTRLGRLAFCLSLSGNR